MGGAVGPSDDRAVQCRGWRHCKAKHCQVSIWRGVWRGEHCTKLDLFAPPPRAISERRGPPALPARDSSGRRFLANLPSTTRERGPSQSLADARRRCGSSPQRMPQ